MQRDEGREIAGFRIESEIGRGGMGVVYLAHKTYPERNVALPDDRDRHEAEEIAQDVSTARGADRRPLGLTIYSFGMRSCTVRSTAVRTSGEGGRALTSLAASG